MRTDNARPDYRRARVASLQQLARAGDVAAVRELERRGESAQAPTDDVTTLDYAGLRAFVLAWNDGAMPADREQNRARAERAQAELEVRYRVDARLWDGRGVAPRQPPAPPWLAPRPARSMDWQRPAGSKVYPSDVDLTRAAFNALARASYEGRQG